MQKKLNEKYHILYIAPILTLLFITHNTSALDYQNNTNIQFTFSPTISLSISGDLIIDELSPGNAKDSNIVDVNVSTNNVSGYTLSATVGNNTNPSSDLVHITTPTYKFTNTSTSVTELPNLEPSTWGYNYSTDNGTTWHDYSSLPLYNTTGAILSEKYSASNDVIKFKIGAKADNAQASGTYTNTINFTVITHPSPLNLEESFAYFGKDKVSVTNPDTGVTEQYYTMQDMESGICGLAETESTITLVDIRDNQTYSVAKLKDDRCWMTENLNIAGGTALSSTDTDFDPSYTLPSTDGWTISDNKLVLPISSTAGFNVDSYAYVYNAENNTDSCPSPGCYGYYSWDAATVGSGRDATIGNTNVPYSICPRGWHLPTSANFHTEGLVTDFGSLAILAGGSSDKGEYNSATSPTGHEIFEILSNLPYTFLRSGHYVDGSFGGGTGYWSSYKNAGGTSARYFDFTFNYSCFDDSASQKYGFSVRCLAR